MTRGCSKLHPRDCPSKHAKRTFLGRDVLSAPLHCLPLCLSPWKQNKIFLINSRAWLITLPSIAIPQWSHVTSANKSGGWKEPFCLPAMESRRAPWLPACQIIYVCLFIMHLPPFQIFLTHCAGRGTWCLFFEYWVLNHLFHSSLSPSSRGSLVPLHFLP